jgi:DNA repair protein RecO (recombination protein O)
VGLVETDALLVRTVEVGESDVIATLFTEQVGKVGAVVRGARKGSRRVGGALEPVHTIAVLLDDRGAELTTLKEARIVRMRPGVVADLDRLEAAGVALRWARHLFPPRTAEPEGWALLTELLDALDGLGEASPPGDAAPRPAASARTLLARTGFAILTAVGYGMDFDRCVVCGRPCPDDRSACVDPSRGGLVCRSCGGAAEVLLPAMREAARTLSAGRTGEVTDAQAAALLGFVDRAMAAHAGFER